MRGADFFSPRELILREVTQEKLMSYYLGLEIDLSRKYASPLRQDNSPGCSFWYSPKGILYFNDFALGRIYTWWDVVRAKYKCDFGAAMRIVMNDLPQIKNVQVDVKEVKEHQMDVVLDTTREHSYWREYGISDSTLRMFDVYSAKSIYIDDDLSARSTAKNPIFVYQFPSGRIKVYRPLGPKKTKWGGNANAEDIGGMSCFPNKGVLCFITSSIKDCMVLKEMGFPAVCMNGEGYGISAKSAEVFKQLVQTLKKRFRHCLLLLDNDEAGQRFSSKLGAEYRLPFVFIPKSKDVSDSVHKYGYDLTFKRLKKLISHKYKHHDKVPF